MRYFTKTIQSIREDIVGLFGSGKVFYTFLMIGLVLWLVTSNSSATFFPDIGRGLFLFCLIKLAVERAPERERDSSTMAALNSNGISDVTKSRASLTYNDIGFLYTAKEKVKIAGFFVDDLLDVNCNYEMSKGDALKANDLLVKLIKKARDEKFKLNLLMLDPLARAAFLHQSLDGDFLNRCTKNLESIKILAANFSAKVEIRLCRTYPMVNLAIGDDSAIFQPWLFKNYASERNTSIAVFSCTAKTPIVSWLETHFDAIWEEQSVSLVDFLERHAVGTDCAVHRLNITNMYVAKDKDIDATDRMLAMLEDTSEFLCIKQVSLHHLMTNDRLKQSFEKVLARQIPVRLLFIDVESEVAMMRSYCEYVHSCILNNKQPQTANYKEFKLLENQAQGHLLRFDQALYVATQFAIEAAKILQGSFPKLSFKTYYAAPDAAIMLNEHSALFEPLHYGSKRPRTNPDGSTILSGEMPLMEFQKDGHQTDGHVYDVIKSNFEFVWKHLSQ